MPDKLSKKVIETALAAGTGGKPYVMLWDTRPKGLGLRIRQSGTGSWLFRYRPRDALRGTAVKTLTLGTWPLLSVEGARTLALGHAAKIALGEDPGLELQQQKLRQRSTVGAALEDYELALNRRHIVNRKPVMVTLRKGFAPMLASEIDTLGLRDVVALIDRIATTKRRRKDGTVYVTPGAAADFRKHCHGFLGWAALQGLVKSNVLAGFRRPKQSARKSATEEGATRPRARRPRARRGLEGQPRKGFVRCLDPPRFVERAQARRTGGTAVERRSGRRHRHSRGQDQDGQGASRAADAGDAGQSWPHSHAQRRMRWCSQAR